MLEILQHYGDAVQHQVLLRHIDILNTLVSERVCGIFYSEIAGFTLQECCDDWFEHKLSKDECLELSELFKEIAEQINDKD